LVSVIIPTYGRPAQLAACLRALAVQDRLQVELVRQPHRGPASTRNSGTARARGAVLAFTDDDSLPAPEWLHWLVADLDPDAGVAVGGRTVNALARNPFSTASQLLVTYLYAYYNADHQRARFFTTNNLAFPRRAFERIGGFDTSFTLSGGEDRELCDRWLQHGLRMRYEPRACAYHAHALTTRGFLRQHFTYGRGACHFRSARLRRGLGPVKTEPPSFYAGMLSAPFRTPRRQPAPLLAALLVLAQATTVLGYLYESRRASAPATLEDGQRVDRRAGGRG